MRKFKFAGHDTFPEDDYTKEVVYIDVKGEDCYYRQAWTRKVTSKGGSFWDVISAGVTKNGKKEYLKGMQCSDNFFEKDVKEYLKNREWEKGQKSQKTDELPF